MRQPSAGGESANLDAGASLRPTRRRAIRIMAAAAGVPLTIAAVRATAPSVQTFHWQGEVSMQSPS